MPFQQLQTVIVPVLYPEFRHDRDQRRTELWTDVLALLAWVMIPLGVLAAVAMPWLVPIVLGDDWGHAGALAVPLALAGCLYPNTYLLISALEATRRFRVIWVANAIALGMQMIMAAAVLSTRSVWPAVGGLLVTNLCLHAIHLGYSHRRGLLDARRCVRSYAVALTTGIAIGVFEYGVLYRIDGLDGLADTALRVASAAALILIAVCCWGWRDHLPPVRLAERRGLLSLKPR